MNSENQLLACIEAGRRENPDGEAVWSEDASLSRAELESRSNQLAHHLRSMGVGPDVMVGIIAERSLELVVGLLAIVKAGGAYVPIDPDYPDERIDFMLQDASTPVLLTQQHLLERLPSTAAGVFRLDSDWNELRDYPTSSPPVNVAAESLAYTIYTSGSTGKPKGPMNTHQAIVNRLIWMQDIFGLTSQDAVLQKTPFSFDVSVWEFFLPLMTGSRLVLARPGGHRDPAYLAQIIDQQKITLLHFVPSMLQVFLGQPGLADYCASVRAVVCSGEALSYDLMERFFNTIDAELHNLYGPTEAAIDVTHWKCEMGGRDKVVPIGRPVSNTELYVLDEALQPVAHGEPGELHIGGVQVARGYHNRPELTAERFIADPFSDDPAGRLYKTGDLAKWRSDGSLEYLGRMDHQIKIRGFRVELGEIEDSLRRHPGICDAAVVAYSTHDGDQKIAAHLLADPDRAATVVSTTRYREDTEKAAELYELPNGLDVCHLNKSETEFMYNEIFRDRCYFQHGIELPDGACVLDVGANIGLFAVQIASEVSNSKVFAFEPLPPLLEILDTNAALYGKSIQPVSYALGQSAGSTEFTYYEHASILSGAKADLQEDRDTVVRYLAGTDWSGANEVSSAALEELVATRLTSKSFTCPIKTLSTAIAELDIDRIDLLKIDVERSELEVLQGLNDADWLKIAQVVAEVHDTGDRLQQVTRLLDENGFQYVVDKEDSLAGTALKLVYARRPSYHPPDAAEPRDSMDWHSVRQLEADVRSHCAEWLPDYMVPDKIAFLSEFPVTSNGKLDRSALLAPEESPEYRRGSKDQPRDELEAWLYSSWVSILGNDTFGIHDGFFDAGGTSLQAARLVQLLQKRLDEFIYVVTVFESPTIAEYAALLKRQYPDRIGEIFESIKGDDDRKSGVVTTDVLSDAEINRFQDLIPAFRSPVSDDVSAGSASAAFILAPPRSGTTLLRVMLAGHSQLFAAPELQLLHFDTLGDRRAAFRGKYEAWLEGTVRVLMELNSIDADEAKGLMEEFEDRNLTTNDFYGVLQGWIGHRLLIDKTPSYALDPAALEHAESDFDKPKFIHLVRHPIAVIRSFEKMHMDQILLLNEHPYDARQLGELVWLRSHLNILEFLEGIPEERQCRIKFESLVSDPKPEMERVCKALETHFMPELVEPYRDTDSKMTTGLYPESTPMGDVQFLNYSEIRSDVADNWQQAREDYQLATATKKFARELGYELDDDQRVADRTSTRRRKIHGAMREQRQKHRRKKA